MLLVAQAVTSAEAIEEFRNQRPDITLMDLRLPGASGTDCMIAIRRVWLLAPSLPATRVTMLRLLSFIWLLFLTGSLSPSLVDFAAAQTWTATWEQKRTAADPPTGPGARGSAGMIFDDVAAHAVVFGGLGQAPLNDLFTYDSATDTWVSEAPETTCDVAGQPCQVRDHSRLHQ